MSRHEAVATAELLSIVIRDGQVGYRPRRVGIALGVAPMQPAWVGAHLDAPHAAQAVTAAFAARAGDLPRRRASRGPQGDAA